MDFDTNHPRFIIVAIPCDRNGVTNETVAFSAKSGESFNHKTEWSKLDKSITQGKPFNYYPRGRVEIRNGKATIFLNLDTFILSLFSGKSSMRLKLQQIAA